MGEKNESAMHFELWLKEGKSFITILGSDTNFEFKTTINVFQGIKE